MNAILTLTRELVGIRKRKRIKAFRFRLFYLSFGKEQPDAPQALPLQFLYILAPLPSKRLIWSE
jgi:hypothetical protein